MEVDFFEVSGDVWIFQAAALNNLQPGAKHALPMFLDILKEHSQLWDRATQDTSFPTLKKGYLNPKSKLRVEYMCKSASIFAVFCAIFNRPLKNRFLSVLLFILWHYFITFGLKHCGSRLQKNMNRRGGKREGAGRKKPPAVAKITGEINQKNWRANHQIFQNCVFSTWRKVRAEGTFVNDSNFASWQMAARFVAPNEDVNSDQCQIFNIFRSMFNIYTGKKCSEYLLISFVNERHESGPTIQKSKTDRRRSSVLLARELPYIIHYIYTFSHSCPLSWLLPSPSTSTPLGKCRNVPDFPTVSPSRCEE